MWLTTSSLGISLHQKYCKIAFPLTGKLNLVFKNVLDIKELYCPDDMDAGQQHWILSSPVTSFKWSHHPLD